MLINNNQMVWVNLSEPAWYFLFPVMFYFVANCFYASWDLFKFFKTVTKWVWWITYKVFYKLYVWLAVDRPAKKIKNKKVNENLIDQYSDL